jgi:putative PIN family toxin of toxin-antitoxin system
VVRAVLDANVFVSALIRPESPPGRILHAWLDRGAFGLVLSTAILDEVRRALAYPRLRRYLRLSDGEIETLLSKVQIQADFVEGLSHIEAVHADPGDDKYVVAALEGRANFIVSGDRHLLALGEYEDARVISPAEFLSILGLAI